MKALTIHQPYAHLIVTPSAELPIGAVVKRVENRTWATKHRGALLIHAGKSLRWLLPGPEMNWLRFRQSDFPEMAFGAIIGVVELLDCVWVQRAANYADAGVRAPQWAREAYPWLESHFHASGPCCWILGEAKRLVEPIECRGRQRLFDVDVNEIKDRT